MSVALPSLSAVHRIIAQIPAHCRLFASRSLADTSCAIAGVRTMKNVMLVGGGKIGVAIAEFLKGSGDYAVTVADRDGEALARMPEGIERRKVAIEGPESFAREIAGHDIVLSATPYYLNAMIAEAARAANAHYLDLTEDVASTRIIRKLADGASTAFIPQCGLAPGFISIAAYDLARKFDKLRDVSMRVGALPVFPTNALKYNLTWSTDGLINEYCNPCEAIRDHVRTEVPALEEIEHFALDGTAYEAFNTSGGLGTLCDTLEGRVENLNYKTVRYPGHRDIVKMLVRDLRLGLRRDVLKDVLETAIPITYQDVVLVFVTVSGWRDGLLTQESFAKKIYAREIGGRLMSAIQITTAAGICAMCDLLAAGKLPQKGFVRQEECRLDDFLANRFGGLYA
jgi:saccharopine dehydrogenase-like NADP-dependent oxidoreductase